MPQEKLPEIYEPSYGGYRVRWFRSDVFLESRVFDSREDAVDLAAKWLKED